MVLGPPRTCVTYRFPKDLSAPWALRVGTIGSAREQVLLGDLFQVCAVGWAWARHDVCQPQGLALPGLS